MPAFNDRPEIDRDDIAIFYLVVIWNAMDYLFGGWRHPEEYKIPGMGHINGFSEESLTKLLKEAGFTIIGRVPDDRNPAPARDAVLKMVASK